MQLAVVTQVETIDSNRALREHYGCLTHAAVSMLEATDQVAQGAEANPCASTGCWWGRLVHAGRETPTRLVKLGVLLEAARARGLPLRCSTPAPAGGDEEGPFTAFDPRGGRGAVLQVRPLQRSSDRRRHARHGAAHPGRRSACGALAEPPRDRPPWPPSVWRSPASNSIASRTTPPQRASAGFQLPSDPVTLDPDPCPLALEVRCPHAAQRRWSPAWWWAATT